MSLAIFDCRVDSIETVVKMLYLCKDSANRVQNAQARLKRYAEMQPILCKDSERRAQRQAEKQRFLCLDMLSHILSYPKIVQRQVKNNVLVLAMRVCHNLFMQPVETRFIASCRL